MAPRPLKCLKKLFLHARNRVVPGGNRFPLYPKMLILWFLVPGTGLSLGGNRFLASCNFCSLYFCMGNRVVPRWEPVPSLLKLLLLWFFVPGTGLSLGRNRFLSAIFVFYFLTSNLHIFSLVIPICAFFISLESL